MTNRTPEPPITVTAFRVERLDGALEALGRGSIIALKALWTAIGALLWVAINIALYGGLDDPPRFLQPRWRNVPWWLRPPRSPL